MKKVSKKINKAVSLSKINFLGLSSSQYWLGYFERKNAHESNLFPKASKLVEEFFGEGLEGFVLISALASLEDKKKSSEDCKYDEIYKMMKENDFFVEIGENENVEDILFSDFGLPAKYITLSLDRDFYLQICETVIVHNLIVGGVCCLINPEKKIALYPHEDIGYGVIAFTEDKTLGARFLNFCKKDEAFYVYIKSENKA